MPPRRLLQNATLILPDGVQPDSALIIENGRIAALGPNAQIAEIYAPDTEIIDVRGAYVMPGLIDLHTDTLEKEITPRPAADFPIEVAVQELDRKLIACGITTVYHSLHFVYEEGELANRSAFTRAEIVSGIRALAARETLAKTRIHARFEVVGGGPAALGQVTALLETGAVDLLSLMDHTPGQGQYTLAHFMDRQVKNGFTEEQARERLREKQDRPRLSQDEMLGVVQLAVALGIPVASHDDDTPEKVRAMHELGVTICEFPITLAAAQAARSLGHVVLGGASNVLRGGSLTGNLNVATAIRAGAIDGLCSDYYPPAMLHAVFKLWRERVLPLHAAVNTATLIPAQAAGIDDETGSIEVGKEADLLIVRLRGETPVITHTFVRGERVHVAGREVSQTLASMSEPN